MIKRAYSIVLLLATLFLLFVVVTSFPLIWKPGETSFSGGYSLNGWLFNVSTDSGPRLFFVPEGYSTYPPHVLTESKLEELIHLGRVYPIDTNFVISKENIKSVVQSDLRNKGVHDLDACEYPSSLPVFAYDLRPTLVLVPLCKNNVYAGYFTIDNKGSVMSLSNRDFPSDNLARDTLKQFLESEKIDGNIEESFYFMFRI